MASVFVACNKGRVTSDLEMWQAVARLIVHIIRAISMTKGRSVSGGVVMSRRTNIDFPSSSSSALASWRSVVSNPSVNQP